MAERKKTSRVTSESINQRPSNSQCNEELQTDRDILSNETLSDVNQLDAFGGDRPVQDLVDDESIQDAEDQKYNR